LLLITERNTKKPIANLLGNALFYRNTTLDYRNATIDVKKEFEKLVKSKNSFADILRHFGFAVAGRSYQTIKERCAKENIDISHIPLGICSNKGRKFRGRGKSLEEVMVENSTYQRGHLKKRLLKNGMIDNKCEICEQEGIWNGIELTMVLDHINGKRNDHRRENLRMLCPNCNSQQATFSGKNKFSILKPEFDSP
jgi:Zn finger protein HypA/HybF involved in hydrogenase expression